MGGVFQFFFKYPALTFEQGDFTFAASRSMTVALVALGVIAAGGLIT
jgi:hypothetical protein